ncbi:hypothetical protein IAD21_02904 [Abditibacteriota bacterium]|nr:hypothetical protein IAD21_02904 [Abditibacteriota bacterium]
MSRFFKVVLVGAGLLIGGCSKGTPAPDPDQVPVSQKIDSIQKDPSLTPEQKQQKIQALQQAK